MIGLLIITHETLGIAYTRLANHFFPHFDFSHVQILNVEPSENHEQIINRAQAMLPQLNRGHGVLILTDIFGATPCNAALKLITPTQYAMITGLNAPMLIKAVNYSVKSQDLHTFTELVKEAGVQGIMSFTDVQAA